jgi:protein phosphatase
MQLRGATATHVGNVRETNQDRAHFGGYVAVVADGMGGHQGGEMAASIAIREFIDVTGPIGPGGLVDLVEGANKAVFEQASDPDLRGMGTTLVALTLRSDEHKVSVVNVGDSRGYFLRGGELGQLTNDHSLVEDLVRQNRLTPEEALTHPQRNILTRALGISSHVEVDRFLISVQLGDRFLLCSDGLFNEVPEEEIARILSENAEPNHAADALIAAALAGAGRDNITVAIVDVVEDGHGGNLSSQPAETLMVPTTGPAQAPTGPEVDGGSETINNGFAPEMTVGIPVAGVAPPAAPAPQPQGAGPQGVTTQGALETDSRSSPGNGGDVGAAVLEAEGTPAAGRGPAAAYERPLSETAELPLAAQPSPRRKRRRGRRLLLALVVLAVLGGGYYGVQTYALSGWFVGESSGQVAVFRGRPGGFLWVGPEAEETDLDVNDLTADAQEQVRRDMTFDSEEDARSFVDALASQPSIADTLGDVEPVDGETTETTETTQAAGEATASSAPNEEAPETDEAEAGSPSASRPSTANEPGP